MKKYINSLFLFLPFMLIKAIAIYGIVKTDDGEFGIMHFNFTI
jgi:hypothetical protein